MSRRNVQITVAVVTAVGAGVVALITTLGGGDSGISGGTATPGASVTQGAGSSSTIINGQNVTVTQHTGTVAAASLELDVVAMLNALNQDEYEAAVRKADQILKVDATNFRAFNTMGAVAFYRADFKQAVTHFEKALALKPDSANIKTNLADAYLELGWIDKAITLYDEVKTPSPDWWYAQGRAYVYGGRYRDAEQLLALVPTNFNRGTGRILRAAALKALADPAADEELKAGMAQDPEYWRAILAGQRTEKRESYTQVAKLLEARNVSSN